MKHKRLAFAGVALAVIGLGAAACSDNGSDTQATPEEIKAAADEYVSCMQEHDIALSVEYVDDLPVFTPDGTNETPDAEAVDAAAEDCASELEAVGLGTDGKPLESESESDSGENDTPEDDTDTTESDTTQPSEEDSSDTESGN